MRHAPWMNIESYLIQGAVVMLAFVLLYFSFRISTSKQQN
jgi:hypothetical protein